MTTILRPSMRQLARTASGLTARSFARPAFRVARSSPSAPPAVSRAVQFRRLYSSEPPRPPPETNDANKNDKKSDPAESKPPEKKEGEPGEASPDVAADGEPAVRSPPGWVKLSEEDIRQLQKFSMFAPASQRQMADEVIRDVKKLGAPPELRDLLAKARQGGLGIADSMRVLRVTVNLAEELAKFQVEQEKQAQGKGNKKVTFDSNAPRPPGQDGQTDSQSTGGQQASGENTQGQQQQQQQNQQQQGDQGGQGRPNPGQMPRYNNDILTWVVGTALLYPFYRMIFPGESSREITWQELRKNFLDKGLVERMVVIGDRVRVELNREATQSMYPDTVAANPNFYYYFSIGSVDAFERRLDEAQAELGIPSADRIPVSYSAGSFMSQLIMAFGPTLLLIGLLGWASRRSLGGAGGANSMFGFGKSKAKMFNHESAIKIKFADVAGMDEAKVEIMEFVSFLKQPERFERLGAKIPRGAILSGPPGTGKTLLAKATAGESQVPFFSVSGSEFVEMFVGVGASRVRDLFATARKNAPCIIFIDEIDAVGRARQEGGQRFGGNDEREATLNQILTEMDGFNTSEQVVVLAGTNRPDVLDKALMRPGRFDRHIVIERPTTKGRQDIFRVHLKKIVTSEDMDYLTGRLAALTPGFAGADIANAVNEAALIAARANATSVELIHFEQAIERVIGGLERKSMVLSPEEKRTVAYHEAGHAICGWFFKWADPLLKVSIIPRGSGALGYAQYLPTGDAYLMNTQQLMDRMAMTLGGRVSEELHFPTVTTGASDDFKKVTNLAQHMVTQWGMSEKLGPLHFANDPASQFQKPFAESTAQTIDAEVRRIVDEAYKQCRELLEARKKEIGLVAEELLRKEVLTRDDLVRLLGPRPFKDKEEFSKFFDGSAAGRSAPPPFPTEETDSPDFKDATEAR